MPNKVKTARGETLDFDLLKIKEQMATAPQELHVRKRKDFIEQRLRRRVKSAIEEEKEVKKQEVVNQGMEVSANLPNTEVEEKEEKLVEVETKPENVAPKQRAKRRTTTTTEPEGEINEPTEQN